MSNPNQEIIESRLATFIDGELDAGERLEIEQHLQQNPQYRKVLDDLRKQRDMLRGLPREAAPLDLAEAFTNQLERAVLLDQDGDDDRKRMRIYAIPRLVAAAIVLLTIGLASIVYFVLPDRGSHTVAANAPGPKPAAPQVPLPPDISSLPVDERSADRSPGDLPTEKLKEPTENKLSVAEKRTLPIAPSADFPAKPAAGPTDKDAMREEVAGNFPANSPIRNRARRDALFAATRDAELDQLARNVSNDPQVKGLLLADHDKKSVADPRGIVAEEARVLVVRSSDPKQVESELVKFFSRDHLDWQPASPQVELALNTTLSQQTTDALQNSGPVNRREIDPESVETADHELAEREKQALAKSVAPQAMPAPSPATEHAMANAHAGNKPGFGAGGGNAAHGDLDAAKGSITGLGNGTPPGSLGRGAAAAKDRVVQDAAEVALESKQGLVPNAAPVENMYIVRRLTRRQAEELNTYLAKSEDLANADAYLRLGEYRYAGAAEGVANSVALNSGSPVPAQVPAPAPSPSRPMPPSPQTLHDVVTHDAKGQPAERSASADNQLADGMAGGGAGSRADDDHFKEIVHKGDDLRLRYAAKDVREESETVKVKEDGTIAAKGKSVQAAGRTLEELQRTLAQPQSTPAGATSQPAIIVERLAAEARSKREKPDAPSGNAFRKFESATRPSAAAALGNDLQQRRAGSDMASTVRTGPIAFDSDQPEGTVDVVIVVQKQSSPADGIAAPSRPAVLASPIAPAASPVPAAAPAAISAPRPTTQPAPASK